MALSFSVVVCTYNRAGLLAKTLDSLSRLAYAGQFEIVVVAGPSTDDTDAVIAAWHGRIRSARCAAANLSASRNIGVGLARGDIVAFIDDDAVAEADWLTDLAAAYDHPQTGAAGGVVFGHTGYELQYEYATANRLGGANWRSPGASAHLCFPGSFEFPYLQGTNASFRRSVLLALGGFDEVFDYYLDETEICCRVIDAGFLIRQLPGAVVHHKFAPSAIRDHQRIVRDYYPIVKNKIYFSYKHAGAYLPPAAIAADNRNFIAGLRQEVAAHEAAQRVPAGALMDFDRACARAWQAASASDQARRAGAGNRAPASPASAAASAGASAPASAPAFVPAFVPASAPAFVPFAAPVPPSGRCVLLVSADYPPHHKGGIATFIHALAEALAAQGDLVHVIVGSSDIDRVDLENGVWVHRMLARHVARTPEAHALGVPQPIWNWSATAHLEACRIAAFCTPDLVEAPVWDAEGIAFLLDRRWPLVTSLHTTLHFWLDTHAALRDDAHWMAHTGAPMLALEQRLMQQADAVRANSAATRGDIEAAYGLRFDAARTMLIPMGLAALPGRAAARACSGPDGIEVLFVGRLEQRKGIDVLLAAIPAVLAAVPAARFRIIGDDTLADADGVTPRQRFQARHRDAAWLERVRFEGRVDDAALQAAYGRCDLFVAPSRYESFGLVFLEAMRQAKAVIGCRAGGMPEVVVHGVTGLLVAPGDAAALAQALGQLLTGHAQRHAMGMAGRQRFERRFTAKRMAQASVALYRSACAHARVLPAPTSACTAAATSEPAHVDAA